MPFEAAGNTRKEYQHHSPFKAACQRTGRSSGIAAQCF
uniref:Uncharacterized protein n=1 Tax=Anguilla anguilla TaxID=7936 RepID=A0A0E9RVL0_ANGAN